MHLLRDCGYHLLLSVTLFVKVLNDLYLLCLLRKMSTLCTTIFYSFTEPMRSMGNAFVSCGVIYCIDSYNSKSTTINFAYDTKTGQQWNPNIQFTNQYGYNSMVAYNPRERVLYAWDNKRLVTYPITFEKH